MKSQAMYIVKCIDESNRTRELTEYAMTLEECREELVLHGTTVHKKVWIELAIR